MASLPTVAALALAALAAAGAGSLRAADEAPATKPLPAPRLTLAPPPANAGDARAATTPVVSPDAGAPDARIRLQRVPVTPESSGSAVRYLRAKPGWRAVGDLFNPFAPVPKEPSGGRLPEGRASLDHHAPDILRTRSNPSLPRAFRDPVTHEAGIRVF